MSNRVDQHRRRFLGSSAATVAASTLGGTGMAKKSHAQGKVVRWGFVGTGGIANSMARVMRTAPSGEIHAVSSRRMETANEFADEYGIEHRYDSWQAMAESGVIDAMYLAVPTSVKEEIALAAANNGKHVLVEKPLMSAESVRRMADACHAANLAFMDGTHFVHHPRTHHIRQNRSDLTGAPWSVASAFQFNLPDRSNIRYSLQLEPMGAIGDAGWYNMRAAVEYLPGADKPVKVHANVRRDPQTGASIGGNGLIVFEDGSSTTWNCGFDSGAVVADLRITGPDGVINLDDFLSQQPDNTGAFRHRQGGWRSGRDEIVEVESPLSGAALMFENFAKIVAEPGEREWNAPRPLGQGYVRFSST